MTTTDQTYSPYITDGEFFGDAPTLRRLFSVAYS